MSGVVGAAFLPLDVGAAAGLVAMFDGGDIVALDLDLEANGGGEAAEAAADDGDART